MPTPDATEDYSHATITKNENKIILESQVIS